MSKSMFDGASPLLFARAKQLRNNMTHSEMIMWGYLKTSPLGYKFRRQHPLGLYIADFYCHALKLIIEIDGSIHQLDEVKRNDDARQRELESAGVKVIRFKNEEVNKHFEEVITSLETLLQNRRDGTEA